MQKLYGMFHDLRNNQTVLSMSRLLLLVTFCLSVYMWVWLKKDIPSTMAVFQLALLGSALGQKITDSIKAFAPVGKP